MPVNGPIVDAIALRPLQESKATLTPAQSHELPENQQFKVLSDRPLKVEASYEAVSNGKYGVRFLDETAIGEIGYIYAPHFEEIPQVLHTKRSVKLKHMGAELILYRGSRVILEDIDNGSPYCTLHLRHLIEGIGEWQIYVKDLEDGCEIIGTEANNKPEDVSPIVSAVVDRGPSIKVPGLSNPVYLNDPIDRDYAPNFTWNEATHGGQRIPEDAQVTQNLIRVARALQEVRDLLGGRSISINSWYRPPSVNRAVGGARYSRHIEGDAVDFKVAGMHPYDVYDQLNGWWGARGGLASSSIFTHIDCRGHYARWSYGY
jgi:hypothetical protein